MKFYLGLIGIMFLVSVLIGIVGANSMVIMDSIDSLMSTIQSLPPFWFYTLVSFIMLTLLVTLVHGLFSIIEL